MSIEEEYKKACELAGPEIRKKLDEAAKLVDEAAKIAEKHGVTFRSYVSPVGNTYFPASQSSLFPDLDMDSDDLDDVDWEHRAVSEYGGAGWEHSAVCY